VQRNIKSKIEEVLTFGRFEQGRNHAG